MTGFVLEASLGLIHHYCAHSALERLTDVRAQRWLAERMPAEMVRAKRVIYVPTPFEGALEFDTDFKGEPAWEDLPVMIEAQARRAAHERTASVGYARGEPMVGYQEFGVPESAEYIVDWLRALPEINSRMLDKLPRVTWQQARRMAFEWHLRLATLRDVGVAGDDGTVNRLDVLGMPGWYWVQLVTRLALDREGAAMGHCVGGGGYDHMAWDEPDHATVPGSRPLGGIWSLRDPTGRSRVTVEIGLDGIEQANGPENERPDAETGPAFGSLFARCREPKQLFNVPHWIILGRDGSTRVRTKDEVANERQRYQASRGDITFQIELSTVEFSDRRSQDERLPWYRRHERQQDGRRPR